MELKRIVLIIIEFIGFYNICLCDSNKQNTVDDVTTNSYAAWNYVIRWHNLCGD